MKKKIIVRVAVIIIVLISLGNTVVAWQGSNLGEISSIDSTYIETEEQPVHIAPEASGTTVIVTNEWSSGFGPRSNAEIVAINPDGSLLYYNDSYLSYNDVDPVSNKSHTVMYIGHRVLDKPRCNQKCTREDIVLLNLTTGEQKVLWSRATPNVGNSRYHDADLINDTHLLVADIEYDRVFIVNITSGVITWQWQAQKDYNLSKGGPYPGTWTHLNDVEYLKNGTVMASIRNFDEVIFINVENSSINTNKTLGTNNNHSIIYEQHNPDYIPEKDGGPAVVVADSENNRVAEYQYLDGEWNRSWVWRDSQLRWPRDADRLPNGHTLITDSNGDRVIEVSKNGSIVWSLPIGLPYEAERLETGDESEDGPSAMKSKLVSKGVETEGDKVDGNPTLKNEIFSLVTDILPASLVQGLLFITPTFIDVFDFILLSIGIISVIILVVLEVYWRGYRVRSNFTVEKFGIGIDVSIVKNNK